MTDAEYASGAHSGDVGAGSGNGGCRRRASGAKRCGRRLKRTGARFLVPRALAVVAAAAVAAVLAGCSSGGSTKPPKPTPTATATHKTHTTAKCLSSGCAVVRMARSLPPLTVFYGASCSGIHGFWFFNAVEGGGGNVVRPSYALQWSFAGGSTSARPNARAINVPRTRTTSVTMTLRNGSLKLSGTRRPNTRVTATGSLAVSLTGTASSPSLTFTERGLAAAEHQLGLVSPFDFGGHPLVVPIKHVRALAGC